MTRVESVSVAGLGGRSGFQSFEFAPDVNVLFGLNGRGKTSLLRIIHSALRNDGRPLEGVAFEEAQVAFYSHMHGRTLYRAISRDDLRGPKDEPDPGFADDEFGYYPSEEAPTRVWRSSDDDMTQSFQVTFLPTARLAAQGGRTSRAAYWRADEALSRTFVTTTRNLWRSFTNRTLSEVTQVQQAGLATILQETIFGTPASAALSKIDVERAHKLSRDFLARQGIKKFESLPSFEKRYREDERLRAVVAEIESIERGIRDAVAPRRKLEELLNDFFDDEKRLELSDREISFKLNDAEIPLGGLSSGEKQLVLILLEMVNAGESVLMVDEPELSMHIDWQRRLVPALRAVNPVAQVILATHSPEIMADVPDSRIHQV